MTTNGLLYKYRSLDNWRWTLDIIVNSRLYAAKFKDLNDPMEGRYFYSVNSISKGFLKTLLKNKLKHKICSLSEERNNTLLWSYYANGHTGVAFGVRLPKTKGDLEVRTVKYDSGVHIHPKAMQRDPAQLALEILTQKQIPWQHEKEVRVFASDNFVPVVLEEIVLGCQITPEDQKLITTVARQWHSQIKITKIKRSSLDRPEAI